MPRDLESQNPFSQAAEGYFISQAEGYVNECDSDPVHVVIVMDVQGYGPHWGSMYVLQSSYGGGLDEALQNAYEMEEQWQRDNHGDSLDELSKERLEEHVRDYLDDNPGASNEEAIEAVQEDAYQEAEEWSRESFSAVSWTISASEFVAAIPNWTPSRGQTAILEGVNITRRADCEEPEEVDEEPMPRMSSTRRRGAGRLELPDIGTGSGVAGAPHTWSRDQQAQASAWLAENVDLDNLRHMQDRVHEMQQANYQRAERSPGGLQKPARGLEEEAIGLGVWDDVLMMAVDQQAFGDTPKPVRRRRRKPVAARTGTRRRGAG